MSAPSKLAAGIDARLAAYAALAGVALAGAPAAEATFIYSGPININIPSTTAGIYINLVSGEYGTTAASVPGWDLSLWSSTTFHIWANNPASLNSGVITSASGGTSATLVDNLYPITDIGTFPYPIDSSQTYGRASSIETTGATAFVLNSGNNYVGFRFLNEANGLYNYGWAHFSLGSSFGGQPRTLIDYLYENNGSGIIPEPSTMALLGVFAAGAVGVRAWRKCRRC